MGGRRGSVSAIFGITWAWINFSWFASAYDTDDWPYRLTTMVQMIGVVVFALGMPALFASIEHGEHVDNQILVLGYLIMRVAMLTQWFRAARQCPQRTTRPDVCRVHRPRSTRLGGPRLGEHVAGRLRGVFGDPSPGSSSPALIRGEKEGDAVEHPPHRRALPLLAIIALVRAWSAAW